MNSWSSRARTTRRHLLRTAAVLPVALYLPGILAQSQEPKRVPTPACGDDEAITPGQTAGPFYTPDSPHKQNFRVDDPDGETLTLQGRVLDIKCGPQPGCIVELWHADNQGHYDNSGFRLRGHQRTDGKGGFLFDTTVPGRYPYRTRHYHLRVLDSEGRRLLTTQLYFPDEPFNARDGLFRPELLMTVRQSDTGLLARFDFVIATAVRDSIAD